jgi:hypothetical protein
VPRVAWAGVPPLTAGLFCQIILEVVSFAISLVQVVSSVKNSTRGGRLRACVAGAAEPWVKKERSLGGRGGHWAATSGVGTRLRVWASASWKHERAPSCAASESGPELG